MSGAGGKIAALAGASTAVAGTSPHTLTHVRTLAASRFPVAPSRPRSTYPVLMHR
jgi:hypothetical protein